MSEQPELKSTLVRRDNQLEITSHLDVSLDVSSSCKESEFRNLSDAEEERESQEMHVPDGERGADPQESESAAPSKAPFELQAHRRSEEVEILIPGPVPPAQFHSPTAATSFDTKDKEPQLRYCTVCNIDQPLRSKHCSVCHRCVARFDHHCPWLSVCVGEKNHALFVGYLYCQCAELGIGILAVSIETYYDDSQPLTSLRAALIAVSSLLLLLLFSLTAHQTVLVCANLTTWEYRSWKKITYMNSHEKGIRRSPFSLGVCGNVALFLQATWSRSFVDWKKAAMILSQHPVVN